MFLHGGEGVLVSLLLLRRALIPLWGPHTLTASKTNYLPKGPASKYHHTGGQGFNAGILGGCNSVHSILLLPPHSCLSHIQKYIHCIPTAWKLWTVLASILKSNLLFKYHLKQEPGAAPPHTARRLHLELRCLARRFCSWCELLAQPYYMKNSGLKGWVKAFARSTLWASKTRLCTQEKKLKFNIFGPEPRWQSRKTCSHSLLREHQNHNWLLHNHRQEDTGTHQKRYPTSKDKGKATMRW